MKLIGVGLPRTATLSQKVALELLGLGPCYHMVNVTNDLDLVDQWRRALDGNAQWGEIFDGSQSTVDWPGSFFYPELLEVYPQAKVLLSTRDGDSWARSMRETIWAVHYGDTFIRHLSDCREAVDPKWRAYMTMMKEMWDRSGLLRGEETSNEWMGDAIDRYHDQVRETVPSERLLVWSVSDGWEPLCEFLDVPVPAAPFPQSNDAAEFADRVIDASLRVLQQWRAQNGSSVLPLAASSAQ